MGEDEELDSIHAAKAGRKPPIMMILGAVLAVAVIAVAAYVLLFSGNGGPPPGGYTCADGTVVASLSQCPEFTKYICPDGSIVNREEECIGACGMGDAKLLLRSKSHPDDDAIHAALGRALSDFNASMDDEALFYREQLDKNLYAGKISEGDHRHIISAMAIHRFVRDRISLLPQPVNFSNTRDDLTVLESRAGTRDEKALLYRSMLTANGMGSKVVVIANCGAESPCECLRSPQKVYVAIDILPYARMEFIPTPRYPGAPEKCALSSGMVVVDASGGYFGYGLNCEGKSFFTVLD